MTLRRTLLLLTTITVLAAGVAVTQLAPTSVSADARLVSYSSCEEALAALKEAARRSVEQSRRRTGRPPGAAPQELNEAGAVPDAAGAAGQSVQTHSRTNVHEAGVDEPDLVKSDGRRIVSVAGGVLRVIDAVTQHVSTATIRGPAGDSATVSLVGNHVLVVTGSGAQLGADRSEDRVPSGSAMTLFDLGPVGSQAPPREVETLSTDGDYVDARQVGSVVRVVIRSEQQPRSVPAIDRATIADLLPRYRVQRDGVSSSHTVGCDRLSHPEGYTGTSMLTVLTFDLATDCIGDGDPTAIVADGQTVYGTGSSLYVANARRPVGAGWSVPEASTELFRFDVSRPGRPVYLAGGVVPGALLNQYSLSEHDGFLRAATTVHTPGADSQSSVHVLRSDGDRLETVGAVDGLGRGERIYAVRFIGPVGYVVTFKRTDPLYTLDLSDPAAPAVTGELKISGYSAYLHPAEAGRLLGVGQEASSEGRVQGSQISLFDVHDPAAPTQLARHIVARSSSEVELDPHAFLYWPATATVVLPMVGGRADADGSALVLRLDGDRFAEQAVITHPGVAGDGRSNAIRRSLVIGDTLWTVSEAGVMAHDLRAVTRKAWVPFGPNDN